MLYLIGLGLSSIQDISLTGLEIIKKCDHVFIDSYTSILQHGNAEISELCGKEIITADREFTEQDPTIISLAEKENVAFLVVGDPLGATTHTDLIIRAIKKNIPYKVIHNVSIISAVGCCGLQIYRFGETISIPLWGELGTPQSFYPKIVSNFCRKLHSLCLLDIKVKEKSLENLLRDRNIYEPARFMTCSEACNQIIDAGRRIKNRMKHPEELDLSDLPPDCYLDPSCVAIGLARVGTPTQSMVVSTLGLFDEALSETEQGDTCSGIVKALGGPLHSLIIPGQMHPMEIELLTARLLISDNKEVTGEGKGTTLPFLFPPLGDGDLERRTRAMFERHNELIIDCTINKSLS